MADMKKNPVDIQGRNTGKQYSDETGELREGKAKGHPENVEKSGAEAENKNKINQKNSGTSGNPNMEKSRGTDERSNRDSRRSDSSI
jgi:hypothetical protein